MFLRKEGASLPSSQQHKRQKIAVQDRKRQKPKKIRMRLAVKTKTEQKTPPKHFHIENLIKSEQSWHCHTETQSPTGQGQAPITWPLSLRPSQRGPELPRCGLTKPNERTELAFHLMLPSGRWYLFSSITVRILKKGLDLKSPTCAAELGI